MFPESRTNEPQTADQIPRIPPPTFSFPIFSHPHVFPMCLGCEPSACWVQVQRSCRRLPPRVLSNFGFPHSRSGPVFDLTPRWDPSGDSAGTFSFIPVVFLLTHRRACGRVRFNDGGAPRKRHRSGASFIVNGVWNHRTSVTATRP